MSREFVARVEEFNQRVLDAYSILGPRLASSHNFVIALCNLLKETPPEWGLRSRDLCLDEPPELKDVINALHLDIEKHEEDTEKRLPLHTLVRTAVLIKTGAIDPGELK